jgi:hypothetical protein
MNEYGTKFKAIFEYEKLDNKNIETFLNQYESLCDALYKSETKACLISAIFNSGILNNVIYNYLQASVLKNMMDKGDIGDLDVNSNLIEFNTDTLVTVRQLTVKLMRSILEWSPSHLTMLDHLIDRIELINTHTQGATDNNDDFNFLISLKENHSVNAHGKRQLDVDRREPPESFRQLSVIPTLIEITNSDHLFLRKNITHGAFENVEHYLDVQYRLLREDYVGS